MERSSLKFNQQSTINNQQSRGAEFSPAIGPPARCIWGTTWARWPIG